MSKAADDKRDHAPQPLKQEALEALKQYADDLRELTKKLRNKLN
jgi:hypothetical protein